MSGKEPGGRGSRGRATGRAGFAGQSPRGSEDRRGQSRLRADGGPGGNQASRGLGGNQAGFQASQRLQGGYQHGHGEGGSQGGFGGRGRGRGGGTAKVFRDPNDPNPQPDHAITQAEDAYIKGQTTTVGGQKLDLAKMNISNAFPSRPGYGTRGAQIKLFANYFILAVRGNTILYRYQLKLVEGSATGRKLKRIIHLLMMNPRLAGAATDYSSILITTAPIELPLEVSLEYVEESENRPRPGNYKFLIADDPEVLDVSELVADLQAVSFNVDRVRRQEIVQALNIIMARYPTSSPGMMNIGTNRHFPYADNDPIVRVELDGGLDALRGYFRSVRLATCRILYNVNVSHAVMYRDMPLDQTIRHFQPKILFLLDKFLVKVRVRTEYLKDESGGAIIKTKTIKGLARPDDGQSLAHPPQIQAFGAGPKDVRFYLDSDVKAGSSTSSNKAKAGKRGGPSSISPKSPVSGYISVYDFFKTHHGIILVNEGMPVVNVGTKEKPSYLPPELCSVLPGQSAKKLNSNQTQTIIQKACRQPWENAESITKDGSKILGLREPANASLVEKGITVIPKLIAVPGRVLAVPNVQYRDKSSIIPEGGSWNMSKHKFFTGARIGCWSYLCIRYSNASDPYNGQLPGHINEFHNALRGAGIDAQAVMTGGIHVILDRCQGKEHIEKELHGAFQKFDALKQKPSMMLVVLPEVDTTIYKVVKFLGDIRFGIHTVCVIGHKFCKPNGQRQYFGNVALKFNLKAGGTNQAMDDGRLGIIGEGKTMVVGIDVTHPSPESHKDAPSVAGMVASIDKRLGQWPAILSVQQRRKEMVSELDQMLRSRLDLWRQKNNQTLPENILVFRDGVSEGQYATVLEVELPQLRNACKEKYPPSQTEKGLPRFSIVIVGKRHHTRFYPTAERDADQKSNPRNGTVVDRGITEVQNWDFFMQAHTCIQGTARPAHYYVVVDEIFRARYDKRPPFPNGNTADALEDLTHNMCHLFGRATRTVSLCPPAYYADLLCDRGRCYIKAFDESSTESGGAPVMAQMQNDVTIHTKLRNSMFYI